jgi:4-hydroxy-tetrahydrodipicolinate synthase
MFKGSLTALVTPMHEDGKLDLQAFTQLIEWHIQKGSEGLVICGTTGEAATLTPKEREQLIYSAVHQATGRVPIIVGTGTNDTNTSIEFSRMAETLGADACLLVTPYYNKPTQQGLIHHFSAIANAVRLPHLLYNVPSRTGTDLYPETAAELAKHQNIVGIKDATGSLKRLEALRLACPKEFCLLSGDDPSSVEFMLKGGNGVVSVTGNIVPDKMRQLCDFALSNREDLAKTLDYRLNPLHRALFVESNPIPTKWLLHHLNKIPAGIRLPLTPLSPQHHEAMIEAFEEVDTVMMQSNAGES